MLGEVVFGSPGDDVNNIAHAQGVKVLHTSCGYAIRAAANLADPAAPVVLIQLVISFCVAVSLPSGEPSDFCMIAFKRSYMTK